MGQITIQDDAIQSGLSRPGRHRALLVMLWRWLELRRSRRQLAELSDRALDDLGLHRDQVERELRRFF
ncbi:MAG: DUF1127 domain-containing protein [Geminicoccaceae bacterium]